MVIPPVIHLLCGRVCPEEYGAANSPELGNQAWGCPRTGHVLTHGAQFGPSTAPNVASDEFWQKEMKEMRKDGVETSTGAEQGLVALGGWNRILSTGEGVSGGQRTPLLTGAHRAHILQRLYPEKVQSCGVCHLLQFHDFPRTCYWRWLACFFSS